MSSIHTDLNKEQRNKVINIHVSSQKNISSQDLVFIQKAAIDYGYFRIVTPHEEIIRTKGNAPISNLTSPKLKEVSNDIILLLINSKNQILLQNNDQVIKTSYLEKGLLKFNKGVFSEKDLINRKVLIVSDIKANAKFTKEVISRLSEMGFKNISLEKSSEFPNDKIPPPPPVKSKKFYQEIATAKMIKEYNDYIKKMQELPKNKRIIKLKDLERIAHIYNSMTPEQRKKVVNFKEVIPPPPPPSPASPKAVKKGNPGIPPPPPPPPPAKEKSQKQEKIKTGFININGEKHYRVTNNGKSKYYNRQGVQVTKNGKVLNNGKQTNATDVIPGQYISAVYQNNKIVSTFYKNEK